MNQAIFISGTPCTGKTTVSEELSRKLGCKLIKINELAIENDFILGTDEEKGYKIIDVDKLNTKVNEIIDDGDELTVFEGHLAHLCDGADKVIILRVHPDILKERLSDRNYSDAKIRENLEAEAMGVCSAEAYGYYRDNIYEIDVSDLTVENTVEVIEDIIDDTADCPPGGIDFMDWLIDNP